MNPNRFKNLVEICHREWLSEALEVPQSHKYGVDLLNDNVGIELKCRLRRRNKHGRVLQGNNRFAVHEYQVQNFPKEHPEVNLYWAFLLYDLDRSVKDVPSDYKPKDIENLISGRETWFFNWNWIHQFSVSYPKTGPYRYVGKRDFPEENHKNLEVNDGRLYVNSAVDLKQKLKIK